MPNNLISPQETNPEYSEDFLQNAKIYGSDLLQRPYPKGYQEEWAESLKHSALEEEIEKLSLLVFRIKTEWFALPTHIIIEIIRDAFIHSLPHMHSDVILGITNVQGELRIAISMQHLLGIPNLKMSDITCYTFSKYSRNIVIGQKNNIFVFPVDEIYGLVHIKLDDIQETPISISKSLKNFFSGIFELPEDKLPVGLLNEKLILNALNENYL